MYIDKSYTQLLEGPVEDIVNMIKYVDRCLTESTDTYDDRKWKERRRLQTLLVFNTLPVEKRIYDGAFVMLNNKYIYALASGKWRVDGKWTWYLSKNPKHFVAKYVLGREDYDKYK